MNFRARSVPNDSKRSLHATSHTQGRAAGVAGAYIFFAALYFVQSVGDPTSGLIAQPVRSLLRSWGESPAALGALMALLAIPWTLKPLFGLLWRRGTVRWWRSRSSKVRDAGGFDHRVARRRCSR